MEKVLGFIKNNYIALLIGALFYVLYVHAAVSGNRICDCESTEKYNSSSTGTHRFVGNRFYHK